MRLPCSGSKNLRNFPLSVGENLSQAGLNQEVIDELIYGGHRQCVMGEVGHEYAVILRLERMVVVPKAVGAESLFIDEETLGVNVCDLGDPLDRDAPEGAHSVSDDEAGLHFVRHRRENLEAHVGGRDDGKVARRREEIPDLIERCRCELARRKLKDRDGNHCLALGSGF